MSFLWKEELWKPLYIFLFGILLKPCKLMFSSLTFVILAKTCISDTACLSFERCNFLSDTEHM